jgi:hypothetical protein
MTNIRRILVLLCLLCMPALSQTVTMRLLTKEDWIQRYGNQPTAKAMLKAEATTSTDPNRVQIGLMDMYLWPSYTNPGPEQAAQWDFWWCSTDCSIPTYYAGPITFKAVNLYSKGTKYSTVGYPPFTINEPPYIGLEIATYLPDAANVNNCFPIKFVGYSIDPDHRNYGLLPKYQSSCISVALQLLSEGTTNTFTLLDGSSFTAYGTMNTFMTPRLGEAAISVECYEFTNKVPSVCLPRFAPVYANRAPSSN